MIRIDIDYPYTSRLRNLLYTTLYIRTGGGYLKLSKTIARMINESPKQIKAYWFFTHRTVPDKELLDLIDNQKHEPALHIINNPYREMCTIEQVTGKKLTYYTVHGTERLIGRIIWGRWKTKQPKIPKDFPLSDFHALPTPGFSLDTMCFSTDTDQVVNTIESRADSDYVLYFHPDWLFQRGKLNHRGPFYQALRRVLNVDEELETIGSNKKLFFTIARDGDEYVKDAPLPTTELLQKLRERGTDIYTFLERKWTHTVSNPSSTWAKTIDNIAILDLTTFDDWRKNIGKKTRNMIRKAEKSAVKTRITEPSEDLASGMWIIYNETPIRQERAFPHFGISQQTVAQVLRLTENAVYIGAYLQDELVGFIQLIKGDNITIISQILSMQKHWDKAVNNALLAKAIEYCAANHLRWVMYGRMGNHPSLDKFKQNNCFTRLLLNRYYAPLTSKGKLAITLGLHREIKDSLPQALKTPLFPIYNWVSRTKTRLRTRR